MSELILRMDLVEPPAGVSFALQRGKDEIVDVVRSDGERVSFTVPVRVKEGRDGRPDFAGPFVQGPVGGRFIYVTVGVRAGDPYSPWDRRAKVPLTAIKWEQIRQAEETGSSLSVQVPGKSKDGGPVCAGIKLTSGDWKVEAA